MKHEWREKAVIERLRELHKMTKQIGGITWLPTQASRVQPQSSQGITFHKSRGRAGQVPPAKNLSLLQPPSQSLKKYISDSLQTFDLTVS